MKGRRTKGQWLPAGLTVFVLAVLMPLASQGASTKSWITGTDWWDTDADRTNAPEGAGETDVTHHGDDMGFIQSYPTSAVSEYGGFDDRGSFGQGSGENFFRDFPGHGSVPRTYTLSHGRITTANEYIGFHGAETFIQTGETNRVRDALYVGSYYSSGTYDLGGGRLIAGTEYIGYSGSGYHGARGTGTFDQTGGTNSTTNLDIGRTGTYTLSGGTLNAADIVNKGRFTYTGGSPIGGTIKNFGVTSVAGGGTETFNGAVTNEKGGTFKINGTTVVFNGPVVQNGAWVTDPSVLTFKNNFTVGSTGYIAAGTGDQYDMYAGFFNNSTVTGNWNTQGATLDFLGTGSHSFDPGSSALYKWGTLDVGAGVTLDLTGGTLYVNDIYGVIIGSDGKPSNIFGGTGGITVVYGELFDTNDNPLFGGTGGTLTLDTGPVTGTGSVPVPAAIWLLAPGLAGLLVLRRRMDRQT